MKMSIIKLCAALRVTFAGAALLLLLPGDYSLAQGKKSSCLLCQGATAKFRDAVDASGLPLDQLGDDGTAYVGTGTSALGDLEGAFISSMGGLWFDLQPSCRGCTVDQERSMTLIFSTRIVRPINLTLRINGGTDGNHISAMTAMTDGQVQIGFGILAFVDPTNGRSYRLNLPGGSLTITCMGGTSSSGSFTPTQWTIEQNGTAPFILEVAGKGNTYTQVGTYYMPFKINLSVP